MGSGFNQVTLMGNLTRDPELRYANNGTPICKFGLAVNSRRKKGDEWIDVATFVDVTVFGKRGEAFAKFHSKGNQAFVSGELRLDRWEDKEGNKRQKLYVVANEWQFVGGKREDSMSSSYVDTGPKPGDAVQSSYADGGGPGRKSTGGSQYLEVDDTPF